MSTIATSYPLNDGNSPADEEVHREEEIDIPTVQPPSFKGALEKYQYGPPTSSTSSPKHLNSSNTTISSLKRKSARLASNDSKEKSAQTSPSLKKKRRQASKYAPPSKYAHLSELTDVLEANLICVFVGFNPGLETATRGHAYAHPSNLFWKLLHSSGLTDRRLRPEEDGNLPRLYGMGNTNLVSRPTKDAAELSKEEQINSTPVLDAKIRKFRPEAVCIVGKSIWENIWAYRYGKKPKKEEFKYGWQDERHNMGLLKVDDEEESVDNGWEGARVFVATSTSGLSASLKPAEKEAIWKPFGEWVQKRRAERKEDEEVVQ